MTAVASVKAGLLDAIRAQLPGVQVSVASQAENTALRESVWIERIDADFEWQLLGPPSANHRKQIVGVDLVVQVYREAGDQTDASDAALTRADEILDEIEAAGEADDTLGGAVNWWLVTRWVVEPKARESGWLADGRAHIEATKHP